MALGSVTNTYGVRYNDPQKKPIAKSSRLESHAVKRIMGQITKDLKLNRNVNFSTLFNLLRINKTEKNIAIILRLLKSQKCSSEIKLALLDKLTKPTIISKLLQSKECPSEIKLALLDKLDPKSAHIEDDSEMVDIETRSLQGAPTLCSTLDTSSIHTQHPTSYSSPPPSARIEASPPPCIHSSLKRSLLKHNPPADLAPLLTDTSSSTISTESTDSSRIEINLEDAHLDKIKSMDQKDLLELSNEISKSAFLMNTKTLPILIQIQQEAIPIYLTYKSEEDRFFIETIISETRKYFDPPAHTLIGVASNKKPKKISDLLYIDSPNNQEDSPSSSLEYFGIT